MPKNNFAAQLSEMKRRSYLEGLEMGKQIQQMADMIVLNKVYGFAGDRLKRLQPELDKIYSEMHTDEPELFVEHLLKRVKQIKGIEVEVK